MNHLLLPIILLTIAVVVDIYVVVLAWRRRSLQGGVVLFFLMLAVSIWTVFTLVELITPALSGKILCSQLAYIGSQTTPVLYLILVFTFTNEGYRPAKKHIPYLFIPVLIAIGLAFTNSYHRLIWTSFTPYPGMEGVIQYGHGPAYWVFVIGYSYLCLVVGSYLVASTIFKRRFTYRRQAIALMIGTLLPWAGNLLYIVGRSPFPGIDGGAVAFSLAGVVVAYSILRYRLLDISPVARDVLFENMVDCLIVLDLKDRIIDINPAGMKLLSITYKDCLGKPAEQILHPRFAELLSGDALRTHAVQIADRENHERIMHFTLIPVRDKHNDHIGRLIVGRDITEAQIMEDKLQQANQVLINQLDQIKALQETLREQTIRDPLTGLYNRRFLDDMLSLQLSQAKRENTSVSMVMIDLDYFKKFNDTYGHSAGDAVINNLAQLLKNRTRHGDFACRFGGEEFLIVMPGAGLEAALRRAEEWRAEFQEKPVLYEGMVLRNTFSAGVAAFPVHGLNEDELIKAADKGLYLAKNSGRNTVACIENDSKSIPQYHLQTAIANEDQT